MEERGFGYIADVFVFALLISTAVMLLAGVSPVDPSAESTRYAASFAQSALLSFQHSSADQFGGFEYRLDTPGFGLGVGDSARRSLRYKTLAQLLAEDALLNLHVEAGGTDLTLWGPNEGMDDELRGFLKSALNLIIGGRFAYRLRARTEPINLELARVHFETKIGDLSHAKAQLCSETLMLSLPTSREELARHIERALGIDSFALELETDPIIEVTLELWSR